MLKDRWALNSYLVIFQVICTFNVLSTFNFQRNTNKFSAS